MKGVVRAYERPGEGMFFQQPPPAGPRDDENGQHEPRGGEPSAGSSSSPSVDSTVTSTASGSTRRPRPARSAARR